jgi:hypothetical protein
MNPLLDLARFGQSYWLDDLTRPMIESGELQRRVTNEGLTGVTANPSIFRAALHASGAYDRQIRELAVHPLNGIYEALIVADVRDACDILRPVYDRTQGSDGALLQARVEEVGTGTYVPPLQRLTFTQVGTKWLASRVRLRASTRADYQTMLDCYLFPYFGPRKYETISRLDIEQCRADLQEGVPESVLRTSPFGRPNGRAKLLSCSFV